MSFRFAIREVRNQLRCWLAWIPELWNRWEPQNTWQEWLRLTAIESALALGIIALGQAIF